jgi:hypothetical protein
MMYLVIRDNEVKMPLADPTIKANGTIWMHGVPLLGITDAATKAKAVDACKRQAWSEIPAEAYTRVGENANGLTVIKRSDYLAAKEAALTPAQRERREIDKLFAKAERLENSDSEDNVSGPMILRSKARKMLADWQAKYPTDAAEEKHQAMLDKAAHLRDMASGALTYDMDGSISHEEQQKRHDDFINQAKAIEAEAAK